MAADALGQGAAVTRDLRRRARVRVAGRGHHLHGGRGCACLDRRSATCPRRRSSRRSSSPCAATTIARRRPYGACAARWRPRRKHEVSAAYDRAGREPVARAKRRRSAAMSSVQAARLPDGGGWHLQHGPIDLDRRVRPQGRGRRAAVFGAAPWPSFDEVLGDLGAGSCRSCAPGWARSTRPLAHVGPVARRMLAACRPLSRRFNFITPMAAVAGCGGRSRALPRWTAAATLGVVPTSTTAATSRFTWRQRVRL